MQTHPSLTPAATHTPGEWHIGMAATDRAIYGPKGEHVATLPDMLLDSEVLANARLIASAPELLAALKENQTELALFAALLNEKWIDAKKDGELRKEIESALHLLAFKQKRTAEAINGAK